MIDGEPLANAVVSLHHVGRGKSKFPASASHGKAMQDGTFALETFDPADGAPEGEFIATVFLVEEKIDADGDKSYGPNLLPPVYSKPETWPLQTEDYVVHKRTRATATEEAITQLNMLQSLRLRNESVALRRRFTNLEDAHSIQQCCRLDTQQFRRASPAIDFSARLFQTGKDVVPFLLLQFGGSNE